MEAKVIKNKFSIFLIDDYLTPVEEEYIWKELDFIDLNLFKDVNTGAIDFEKNKVYKQGSGTWLRSFYNPDKIYDYCHYYKTYKKFLFDKTIVDRFVSEDAYFNFFLRSNYDDTVLNYYSAGDYYLNHKDVSMFSMVYLTCKEEKNIIKGDLYFKENNVTINFKKNRLVIFPSFAQHEVLPVELKDNSYGMGRYSYTTFFNNFKNF